MVLPENLSRRVKPIVTVAGALYVAENTGRLVTMIHATEPNYVLIAAIFALAAEYSVAIVFRYIHVCSNLPDSGSLALLLSYSQPLEILTVMLAWTVRL